METAAPPAGGHENQGQGVSFHRASAALRRDAAAAAIRHSFCLVFIISALVSVTLRLNHFKYDGSRKQTTVRVMVKRL